VRDAVYYNFCRLLVSCSQKHDIAPGILLNPDMKDKRLVAARNELVVRCSKELKVNLNRKTCYLLLDKHDEKLSPISLQELKNRKEQGRHLSNTELANLFGFRSHASIVRILANAK